MAALMSYKLQVVLLGLVALSAAQHLRPATAVRQQQPVFQGFQGFASDEPSTQARAHPRVVIPAPIPTARHARPTATAPVPAPPPAPQSFFPAAPAPATTRAPVAKAIPAPPPLLVADEPRPLTVDRRPAAKALPVATRFESDTDKHLREKDQQELFRKQAESAHYAFDSSVDDGIMGHSHVRQEVRDGLKLSGAYSYSDGFYRRTVHYEADENGYRVIKQESEPIGDGPELDLHGTAKVSSNVAGVTNQYVITADDISELHEKH